ncbi:MAG: UDP-N-acetylglucosamine 2-epimerase (non-hydrolyzing) [Stygiobacter sp.]|nr:MAG: UDP-N-acetylglucosamine 2-epimerase (non-hydrolyzing) [Stygiobacter sp.]
MRKILVVFGTRPEAIKLAPVIKALKAEKTFETIVCSTGQHREMLRQVTNLFDIYIDDDLDLMKPNQTLYDITANSLFKMDSVLEKYKPDVVIVQGDTTTAFVSALAAFYKKIKVAHVEAGLRSYDIFHPYPEEANRRFISVISNFNFAPTEESKQNLLKEGFAPDTIQVTGNTVVDALLEIKTKLEQPELAAKLEVDLGAKLEKVIVENEFVLMTLHRREKFGTEMQNLLYTIKELAEKYSHLNFVYPTHLNPNVAKPVNEILGNTKNILLTEPMDYLSFLFLMSKCRFIMSDSGGVQEECFVFSKPIIVMRTVTERNEAIDAGYAFLTGSDREKIFHHFSDIDTKLTSGFNFFPKENPFGDGKSSDRIVEILKRGLN